MTLHRKTISLPTSAVLLACSCPLLGQGYGTLTASQLPQTNAPAGIADVGLVSRPDGSLLLFGGQQSAGLFASTYTQSNGVWQPRVSVLNPAQRSGHQLAFDGVRGEAILFGGIDQVGSSLADTWVFANNQWTYRPLPTSPSARNGHRMCFDAARGNVLLFGGRTGGQQLLQDTWTWNGNSWAQVPTVNAPVARFNHGVAYDAERQKVVLFGGESVAGVRNDVWEWDGQSWGEVFPSPVNGVPFVPDPRSQHAMGYDASAGRVVVFGGQRGASGLLGDVWSFDGVSWVGLLPGPGASVPTPRSRAAIVPANNGRVQVFGGSTASGLTSELWELTLPVLSRVGEYGAPCVGSAGPLRLRPAQGASASLGSNLVLHMTGLGSPFALGWGFLGLSRTSANGVGLPADLGVVGIPGCDALMSADFSFGLGLPSGSPLQTTWALPVPNDVYFLGLEFFLQGLALESFGFSRFATVTNGVSVRVGSNSGSLWTLSMVESFADEANMETAASGGLWAAGARSSSLGGDGRHGSFRIENGVDVGNGTYEWNVDNFTFPSGQTLSGAALTVTDGRFFFTDFQVPAGSTVRFVGTSPLQIHVCGEMDVSGRVQANGVDQVTFNCRNTQLTFPANPVAGQAGSLGGPGGARGGQGGDRCFGAGALPNNNGRNGQDLLLPAGHAYALLAGGTGGRGSPLHPAHGLDLQLSTPVNTYTSGGVFNSNVGYGGSGGGYSAAGSVASNVAVVPDVVQILPASPVGGGVAFDPLPLPSPSTSSLAHFLIGGSGGGGGGSHPFLGLAPNVATFNSDRWKAGGGGAGGGGVLAVRAGRNIRVAGSGRLEARGGRGATYNGDNPSTPTQDAVSVSTGSHWGIPVPGGGGSGGTVLLQANRDVVLDGVVDTGGGAGGKTDGIWPNSGTSSLDIDNRGGAGAPGFYRAEAGSIASITNAANVPPVDVARNVGSLRAVDTDAASACQSKWRATGLPIPPQWLRYEMHVDVDGDGIVDRIYSDDPLTPSSIGPAIDPLGPVTIKFQGTRFNASGAPDPLTIGPWRNYVANQGGLGIQSDSATGFKFHIVFNRQAFPNCVVKRVEVLVRG